MYKRTLLRNLGSRYKEKHILLEAIQYNDSKICVATRWLLHALQTYSLCLSPDIGLVLKSPYCHVTWVWNYFGMVVFLRIWAFYRFLVKLEPSSCILTMAPDLKLSRNSNFCLVLLLDTSNQPGKRNKGLLRSLTNIVHAWKVKSDNLWKRKLIIKIRTDVSLISRFIFGKKWNGFS